MKTISMINLEQQIAERKQQAKDKGIYQKAKYIAQYIGNGYSYYTDNIIKIDGRGLYEPLIIQHFLKNPITGNESFVDVFNGKDNEVSLYIPGSWEDYLDPLYAKAEEKHQIALREVWKL